MRVGVTGATGFVGRNVLRVLADEGHEPVAVVRSPHKLSGVEARKADLSDRDALRAGFEGLDAVVLCAALVSLGHASAQEVVRTNLVGTENQVIAAAEAGVRRIVLVSSTEVYAPTPTHDYPEDAPLRDDAHPTRFTAYGVSKAAAERRARELAEERGLLLTILRPSAIHGPHDRATLLVWMRRLLRPPITVFPTHVQFTSVYVGDLAVAAIRALETPECAGRAYNICGDPDVTFWQLMQAWRDAGGPMPWLVLPVPIPFRRHYPIDRARAELGYVNRPLVDGFRETFAIEPP